MKIIYDSKKVEKAFSSEYIKSWRYPEKVKRKLVAMENFIVAADSFNDLIVFPSYRCHQLKGDRAGEWSLYVGNTGYRVTLIPCDDDGKKIIDGDIIAQCKFIKIVVVTEVSNHYE